MAVFAAALCLVLSAQRGAQGGIVYRNSDIAGLRRADTAGDAPAAAAAAAHYALDRQLETAFLIKDVGEVDVFVPIEVYNYTTALRINQLDPNSTLPEICLSLRRVAELFCLHPRHPQYAAMRLTLDAEAVARSGSAFAPHTVLEASWIVDTGGHGHATPYLSSTYDLYIDMLDKRPAVAGRLMRRYPDHALTFRSYDQDFLFIYEADTVSRALARGLFLSAEGIVQGTFPFEDEGRLTAQGVEPGSWFYCVYPLFDVIYLNSTDSAQVLDRADSAADIARKMRAMAAAVGVDPSSGLRIPGASGAAASDLSVVSVSGYPTCGAVEFVPSEEHIRSSRVFQDDEALEAAACGDAAREEETTGKREVCVWGSNALDGQRRIWIEQVRYFERHFNDEFHFQWVFPDPVFDSEGGWDNSHADSVQGMLAGLRNVRFWASPYADYPVSLSWFVEDPGDGTPLLSSYYAGNESAIYEYAVERLHLSGEVAAVRPLWVRSLLEAMRDHLLAARCDVVVYGNNRGLTSDIIITETARSMGVRTAIELMNLFVTPKYHPDFLIAPSKYAAEHHSITRYVDPRYTRTVVISPAVDVEVAFNRSRLLAEGPPPTHPACSALQQGSGMARRCVHVAFLARLSNEKNVNLFVFAASELLKSNMFYRFTIIGGGALRPHVIALCHKLQIAYAFDFPGWVSFERLPRALLGVDILVNPSLRDWSETFCIANIEAMALGIPLVTFAVGGVGQYVEAPQTRSSASPDSYPSFEMGGNAVVISRPHPLAVRDAVEFLVGHPVEGAALAQRGVARVQRHFSLAEQMRRYRDFYLAASARPTAE